ncbi:hypothetical protein Taro_035419 [Colocasia esculenta]|uniref:Uncharacterized protein n=1 Tax=Colocasia esculenta TaxID=4460 RepID=A0A843W6L4_COLES|nr:hypothetical protein [Colocasia esculenta]
MMTNQAGNDVCQHPGVLIVPARPLTNSGVLLTLLKGNSPDRTYRNLAHFWKETVLTEHTEIWLSLQYGSRMYGSRM